MQRLHHSRKQHQIQGKQRNLDELVRHSPLLSRPDAAVCTACELQWLADTLAWPLKRMYHAGVKQRQHG
jgi:hypothetical protein